MVYRDEVKEKDKNLMYRITALVSDLMHSIDIMKIFKFNTRKCFDKRKDKEQLYICFEDL